MNASVPRERAFQRLMQRLDYPATACARVRAVCAFIDALPAPLLAHEPYLLELATVWPSLVADLCPVGADPRLLHQLHMTLTQVCQAVPDVQALPEVQAAGRRLREHTALAFAQVGAYEQMAAVLPVALPEAAPERRTPAKHLTHLARLAAAATAADPAVAEELRRLEHAYTHDLLPADYGCWVPVIEQAPGAASGCGRLRRLTARLVGPAVGNADEIHADVSVFGVGQSRAQAIADAASAARQRLQQTHPWLGTRYRAGAVHFDAPFVPHEGRSAHLALAAALYGAFLREAGAREQYALRPRVALTGDLDAAGRVLPVDPETLPEKARAVFFSPATTFVVPEAQVAPATAAVAQLQEVFPRRMLPVIGVAYLEDVFHDRRASRLTVAGPVRHGARQLWRRRGAVASGTAILLLLVVLAGVVYGPTDRTPVSHEVEGKVLLLQNRQGQTVGEVDLGPVVAHRPDWMAVAAVEQRSQGQRTDVCYVTSVTDQQYLNVQCHDGSNPEPRWQRRLSRYLNFPHALGLSNEPLYPSALKVGDFSGDGVPELLVAMNQQTYFPGLVVRYDVETGDELGVYLHPGRIYAMEVADVTGNGVQEVVLGGVSNAHDSAFIAILDPRALDGHGPLTMRYQTVGWERATELAYVRIPRTMVGESLRRYRRWTEVIGLRIDPERERITARVMEGHGNEIERFGFDDISYHLSLDFQLRPQRIGTSDTYDVISAWLEEEGQLASLPTVAYFEQFMQGLQYWNGTTWQQTPYFTGAPVETTPPPSMVRR